MEEAYRAHVRQEMDAAGWHWPEHLLMDPARGPRFLSSAAELLHELQLLAAPVFTRCGTRFSDHSSPRRT